METFEGKQKRKTLLLCPGHLTPNICDTWYIHFSEDFFFHFLSVSAETGNFCSKPKQMIFISIEENLKNSMWNWTRIQVLTSGFLWLTLYLCFPKWKWEGKSTNLWLPLAPQLRSWKLKVTAWASPSRQLRQHRGISALKARRSSSDPGKMGALRSSCSLCGKWGLTRHQSQATERSPHELFVDLSSQFWKIFTES